MRRPKTPPAAPSQAPHSITSDTAKELLAEIAEFQGSANALNDWWRGNRARRNTLVPEELKVVAKAYQVKFDQINEADEAAAQSLSGN